MCYLAKKTRREIKRRQKISEPNWDDFFFFSQEQDTAKTIVRLFYYDNLFFLLYYALWCCIVVGSESRVLARFSLPVWKERRTCSGENGSYLKTTCAQCRRAIALSWEEMEEKLIREVALMKHSTRHDVAKTLLFIFLFIYCLLRKLISFIRAFA